MRPACSIIVSRGQSGPVRSLQVKCMGKRRFLSTPPLPASNFTASTPSLDKIVSRRAWTKYTLNNPRVKKTAAKAKPEEEKPWPKSMVYSAYAAASVFVPYSLLWFIMDQPSLRDSLVASLIRQTIVVTADGESLPGPATWLRRHFGQVDPHVVAYPDTIVRPKRPGSKSATNDDTGTARIPPAYKLEGELPRPAQIRQDTLQDELATGMVQIRLVPMSDGMDSGTTTIHEVPASLAASRDELYKFLSNRLGEGQVSSKSVIAVEFPSEEDTDDETSPLPAMESTTTTLSDDVTPATKASKEPLLSKIPIYSSWYYQAPLQPAETTSSSSSTAHHHPIQQQSQMMSNEELQIQQLEYEKQALQAELRNPNTTRPFDDIQDELHEVNAKLRQLRKWGRWWPF